jgi:DNA-directed RNA polymerase beta subunit
MRSGNTGKPLEVPIYHGLVFFQSLKHHVKDKIQYRGLGPIRPVTHQASKGKGNRGGLRFGEMERDAAIAQGSSAFLRERLMFASDAYQAIFCRRCKSFVVFDARIKRYAPCHLCGNTKDFGRCIIPYAAKLLIQLLAAMGIFLRPDFINSEDLINNILRAAGTLGFGLADINNILQEADEGYAQEVEEIDNQNIQTSYRTIFDKSI